MTKNIRLVCHEDDLEHYPECESCTASVCDDKCFEIHPGSLIAMQKVLRQQGFVTTKVYKGDEMPPGAE